jgi:hypothetical protein
MKIGERVEIVKLEMVCETDSTEGHPYAGGHLEGTTKDGSTIYFYTYVMRVEPKK